MKCVIPVNPHLVSSPFKNCIVSSSRSRRAVNFISLASSSASDVIPKELDPDWRSKARPIQPGSPYPAKEFCSNCGLCDTHYVAHVKDACAFLGDGMSRIEALEPRVHGRARCV